MKFKVKKPFFLLGIVFTSTVFFIGVVNCNSDNTRNNDTNVGDEGKNKQNSLGEDEIEIEDDEPTTLGGILNGLLDSFATPSNVNTSSSMPLAVLPSTCPGTCISALASVFLCERVSSKYRCPGNQACCLNNNEDEEDGQGNVNNNNNNNSGNGTTTMIRDEPEADEEEEEDDDISVENPVKNEEHNKKPEGSPSISGGCPGVCLPANLASTHCENVIEESGDFCPKSTKCCSKSKKGKDKHKCEGTCRSVIFGLFLCDEIDEGADCPESHQACCVEKKKGPPAGPQRPPPPPQRPIQRIPGEGIGEVERVPVPVGGIGEVQRPEKPAQRPTVPPTPHRDRTGLVGPHKNKKNPRPHEHMRPMTTTTTSTTTTTTESSSEQEPEIQVEESDEEISQPPPPPQQGKPHLQSMMPPPPPHHHSQQQSPQFLPCPAYCVPMEAAPYCRQPIPRGTCGINAACCAHDLKPVIRTTPPPPPPTTPYPTTTTTEPSKKLPCPGQCIKSIMAFTCFLNAELTDAFDCGENQELKCCAPKAKVSNNSSSSLISSSTTFKPPPAMMNPVIPPGQNNLHPHPHPQPGFPPPPQPRPVLPSYPVQSNMIDRTFINSRRYVCGVKGQPLVNNSRRKRVVGGRDSLPGEWCWQVALINSMNQYLCGGALIGVEWVVTAAHCVTSLLRTSPTPNIYIRLGDHDLTSRYGSPGAQTLRVATTYVHHNHNSQTLDNDIALLRLATPAILDNNKGVCLVCLPNRAGGVLREGRRCTVTGYGYMGESGPIPLRIREAELPVVSDSDCLRKVNLVTDKPFVLPESSFCAGGEENQNDACQGDGGGPLVCKEDDYYELTGLVSWGFGCGRKDVPGVYVKVSNFIGWINQIISIAN